MIDDVLPDKAYLVFIDASFLPLLATVRGNLSIAEKEKYFFIVCESVDEQIHYLRLTIPHDFPGNKKGYDFYISIPHSVILYFASAQKKELNQILGFRSIPEDGGSPLD